MTVKKNNEPRYEQGRGYDKADWDAVDSPELTDEELARMRPAREVLPKQFFESLEKARRARGRPKSDAPKQAVTLRLDPSVIERFKAGGRDWRARMAEAVERGGEVKQQK